MVCTPGNPSGKVYSNQELRRIADFVNQTDRLREAFRRVHYDHYVFH
jgi:aspartate/methionine/tyrosine aminotransferase